MSFNLGLLIALMHKLSASSAEVDCRTSAIRPLFVWAEWPEIYRPSEWRNYFDTLLGFAAGNCGNFAVPKIIIRVTDPEWEGLFRVERESYFFTDFLARIPRGVEIRIYPYLYTQKAQQKWANYSGHARPLQGVFKFAHEWNKILSKDKLPARIGGIVVDGEERHGFDREQPRVAHYKKHYGVPTFAVGIGFDAHKHREFYPSADEFYMEMYDFYDVNHHGKPVKRVHVSPSDKAHTFLETLDRKSLHPFIGTYRDPRMHFMWSVQSMSKDDCIYPLESKCGLGDDFGWFSAPEFNNFLGLVQERYPVLAGRSHGIFQFNYMPPSWL
jgi:hypothetical protein